jgi:copper chaperone
MTQKQTLLKVAGMSCGSCVHHVDVALKDVRGVSKVDVRLREGEALVQHDADTSVESLVKALADAGYESAPSAA